MSEFDGRRASIAQELRAAYERMVDRIEQRVGVRPNGRAEVPARAPAFDPTLRKAAPS